MDKLLEISSRITKQLPIKKLPTMKKYQSLVENTMEKSYTASLATLNEVTKDRKLNMENYLSILEGTAQESPNKPQSAASNIRRMNKSEQDEETREKDIDDAKERKNDSEDKEKKDDEKKAKIEEMELLLKKLRSPNNDLQLEEIIDAIVELKIMEKENRPKNEGYYRVEKANLLEALGKKTEWQIVDGNILKEVVV